MNINLTASKPRRLKGGVKIGTNFYFITTNKEAAMKYAGDRYELVDEPYFGYEIHIGKRSMGWFPLFEYHDGMKSVKEIKEAFDSGNFEIYDEYSDKKTWSEFEEELINHNGGHIRSNNCWRDFDKKVVPRTKNKDGVYIPISHFDVLPYPYSSGYEYECRYFRDSEGYEFTTGEFC